MLLGENNPIGSRAALLVIFPISEFVSIVYTYTGCGRGCHCKHTCVIGVRQQDC